MLHIGDHPAQCEVGKFLNQGKAGCRRCKVMGTHSKNPNNHRMYYGNIRYHCAYPHEVRNINESILSMEEIEFEDRESYKKVMASNGGFTGMSIVHKYLYPLYGFNVLKHFVYDVFHTIPLNLVRNLLDALLNLNIVNPHDIDELLDVFPWTSELKNGQLPRKIKKEKKGLSSWKAEGYKKFGFPAMECILENLIEDRNIYEAISLTSRLVELHFYRGRSGWSQEMIKESSIIAKRLNVICEEFIISSSLLLIKVEKPNSP